MLPFTRFIRDIRGGMVEKVAVIAGAIGLASLASAHFLNVATRDPNSSLMAALRPNKAAVTSPGMSSPGMSSPGIDYMPTASIRKQSGQIVLDPCTGKPK
jgi:hypothetical protein